MIIFFDWDDEDGQDGNADHVDIAEKVENDRVYTIEGNTSDSCRQRSYPLGNYQILGYGIPDYKKSTRNKQSSFLKNALKHTNSLCKSVF